MLKIITPPSAYPVSLEDVHAQLRLDMEFTDDDALIQSTCIPAAVERAEQITHMSLVLKKYLQSFDRFPTSQFQPIRLLRPPLVDVCSVTYVDASYERQTWDAAEYYVASNQIPGLIFPKEPLIYPYAKDVSGAVEVTFHAGKSTPGYGDASLLIDDDIRLAIAQLAAHYYDNPGAVGLYQLTDLPENARAILLSKRVWIA